MDDLTPNDGETLDPIAGDWRIFQLRRGHRFSVDDIVTAWRAAHAKPDARRLLDLGSGIGAVAHATLWRLGHPDATLVTVEVQEISRALALRSWRLNGQDHRVTPLLGDLRDPGAIPAHLVPQGGFELITGSPPYTPEGSGVLPAHPQKAGARFELRGSVYDYCKAARRWLAPDGRFVFVMPGADPRTEDAPVRAGLRVVERLDVTFRAGRPFQIAVLVCARVEDVPEDAERRTLSLNIRDEDGEETQEFMAYKRDMGGFGSQAQKRREERR